MRKYFLLTALFALMSLCCNAQFKLTPSAGLMTEDGPYTITKSGSEVENYEAAKKAVETAISGAEIGEIEYEKSFSVSAKYKNRGKLPGALGATDWVIDYTLKIEMSDDKILVSFAKIGNLEVWKRGEVLQYIHPTTGKNSMLVDITGNHYLFNSKGEICKGGKKMVALFEEMANGIVKEIERNL